MYKIKSTGEMFSHRFINLLFILRKTSVTLLVIKLYINLSSPKILFIILFCKKKPVQNCLTTFLDVSHIFGPRVF